MFWFIVGALFGGGVGIIIMGLIIASREATKLEKWEEEK